LHAGVLTAACVSIAALRVLDVIRSFGLSSAANRVRANGVRSRIAQMISKPTSAAATWRGPLMAMMTGSQTDRPGSAMVARNGRAQARAGPKTCGYRDATG
jgi:hypothetical protein